MHLSLNEYDKNTVISLFYLTAHTKTQLSLRRFLAIIKRTIPDLPILSYNHT
jgi:hypothetical protein